MKSRKRVVHRDILNHCYQNTVNGNLIFYSVSDYLVYFTLFCTIARKLKVKVLMLCLMPDHIHYSAVVKHGPVLSAFNQETASKFVLSQNRFSACSGALMNHPFGSAAKKGDKIARTNIIYVGNNPVERRLVTKAEDYRWNFLAYALSDHPFSEKIVMSEASRPLRRGLKTVDLIYSRGNPLTYPVLKGLFSKLTKGESQQLTDYIVSKYLVIDFNETARFFDNFGNMIEAMHSSTGSEYDINEVFVGTSDAYYSRMIQILIRELKLKDIHEILSYSTERKFELYQLLRIKTDAPGAQIAKLLRMPFRRSTADDFPVFDGGPVFDDVPVFNGK